MKLAQACEGCRKLTGELEDARHEVLEVAERLSVADDLAHALAERLLARHEELSCIPADSRREAA